MPRADARAPSRWRAAATWAVVVAIVAVSVQETGFTLRPLAEGARDALGFFARLTPDPRALPEIWSPLGDTLRIAYLATVFGAAFGLPIAFLASSNTTVNAPVLWGTRTLLTLLRSVPDLLWAAVLVPILAPGALPGVVALTLFTAAALAKFSSETVEAVDPRPLEALRAVGAGRGAVIVHAVLPATAPTLTAYVLYLLEVNVRASVVIGLVGAGGIGTLLQRYLSFFDYGGVGALLAVTFGVVAAIDLFGLWARSVLT